MGQPLRMIDELRRGAALGAERLPGWMGGIGIEASEAAIFDRCHRAAAGDAQPAIAMDLMGTCAIGHDLLPSAGLMDKPTTFRRRANENSPWQNAIGRAGHYRAEAVRRPIASLAGFILRAVN